MMSNTRRILIGILFLVTLAIPSFVKGFSEETLEKDTEIQGITFPAGTEISFDDDGKLKEAVPEKEIEIQNMTALGKMTILFYKNGDVQYITLAKDTEVKGIPYKAKTKIFLKEDGTVDEFILPLATDTNIKGIKIKAGNWINYSKISDYTYIEFYTDAKIQGIQFNAGDLMVLDSDGKILRCFLAKDTKIKNVKIKARTFVEFYSNEQIKDATLAKDTILQGIKLPANTSVSFHENGMLSYVTLLKNTKIKPFTVNGPIGFYDNGKLKFAVLAKDKLFQGIKIQAEEGSGDRLVYFYENGKLKEAVLAEDQKIQKIRFRAKDRIQLYDNGRIRTATLIEDTKIKGKKIKAGTHLDFDEKGNITYMWPKQTDGDTVAPSDVENLKATSGDSEVKLTWDAATDDVGVTGYKIYIGTHSVTSPEDTYDLPRIQIGDKAVQVSHILIAYKGAERASDNIVRSKEESKNKARNLLKQIKNGKDFASAAKEFSDEPGAKNSAGKLSEAVEAGGLYVESFTAAALKLSKVGDLSKVVESPFGFHIIRADNVIQHKSGNAYSYTVTDLINGNMYYFSVTAIDAAGNESDNYSSEASATPAN